MKDSHYFNNKLQYLGKGKKLLAPILHEGEKYRANTLTIYGLVIALGTKPNSSLNARPNQEGSLNPTSYAISDMVLSVV